VYVSANTLRNNIQIQITDVELNTLFGHCGGWAQGMIFWHWHFANSANSTASGRPKAIDSEKKLIRFYLVRQSEKNPVIVQDAIAFMCDNRVQVDKFWIRRFVERNSEALTLQQARLLEKSVTKYQKKI
jgi:hypothetical protein